MATKTLTNKGNGGLMLSRAFNDFLRPWNEWFTDSAWPERALTVPAVNITETDKSYNLSVAAPGMKKEDFNIDVQGNIISISAAKEESTEAKEKNYSRQEYNYSSFCRSFTLPDEVKQDAIEAEYKDGVLNLRLPKTEAAQKASKKIAIK